MYILEKMKKLLKNYEIHLRTFMDKMIKDPIKINKYKVFNMTTRQELFANSSNKILDKKGFSFKSFKTDKERIKAYTQKKEMINIKINNSNKNNIKIKEKLKKNFLKINNIENYKEDINKIINYFYHKEELNQEERLIYEQIKNISGIRIYDIKTDEDDIIPEKTISNRFYSKKDDMNIINNDSLNEETKYKKLMHNKIYNHIKKMFLFRKLKLKYSNKLKKINKVNSNIFSKTHFKALENLTLFKSPTINHKNNKINKTLSMNEINPEKNINTQNTKKIYYKTESNFRKKSLIENNDQRKLSFYEKIKNNFGDRKFSKIFSPKIYLDDLSLTKEVVNINPLLFQYNINYMKNILNKNNKDIYLKDKISTLKKMAFEKNKTNENILKEEKYDNNFYNMTMQNEEMMNNEEKYLAKNSDKIADKLLKKCNWKTEINI